MQTSPNSRLPHRPRLAGLLAVLTAVLSAGCSEVLVSPAPVSPAGIAVLLQMEAAPDATDGAGAAFDKADRIRIRVQRPGASDAAFSLPLPPAGATRTVGPVTLQMQRSQEQATVALELLVGEQVLFQAEIENVALRAGQTASLPVSLVAVPAGIGVPESVPELTSLGDQIQLTGAVLFASGDAIPGLQLTWSTPDAAVFEVTAAGLLTALAEGEGRVEARYGEFSRTLTVQVRPVVVAIELDPDRTTLLPGAEAQLTPTFRDARENALPNRTVQTWTSSAPAVATVDGNGLVTAHAPGTATITAGFEGVEGHAQVVVSEREPVEIPGRDVVVFNDINIFDANAMRNPNNVLLVRNLVSYTTTGVRDGGRVVIFDRGRNARCGTSGNNECNDTNMALMRSTIAEQGFTIADVNSSEGSYTEIAPEVKVIFLWTPLVFFTVPEINAFKRFAAEGGRIVFIGEWDGYYGAVGIAVENDFLQKMGAVLRNTGGAVDCSYTTLPLSSLREHPITAGLTDLTVACASVIEPGDEDYALFYDRGGTRVLAGVAKIDPTPLPIGETSQTRRSVAAPAVFRLNSASSTGH